VIRKLFIALVIVLVGIDSTQHLFATELGNHNKKFIAPNKMSEEDWSKLIELERTWNAALVRMPKETGKYTSAIMKDVPKKIGFKKQFPTVIYLHGCAGVWAGTHSRVNFLAKSGFAVIAPVSFAREKYPQSCDPYTNKAGMYRGTLKMRQYDAGYAIANAKKLAWVDPDNVFLMGHSQGGITTATFSSPEKLMRVNARVVEGWTCHAGWEEYRGINAPSDEPVLTLVGKNDPWFKNEWMRGDCGKFINTNNGSKSVVFNAGYLSGRHELLEDAKVQKIVLEFLTSNIH